VVTCACGYAHSPESATTCKLCGLALPGFEGAGGHGGGGRAPAPALVASDGREHKLVTEGSPPIPLVNGRVFTIGRADECNLPIPSQRVSRQHAEVIWKAGLPLLRSVSETSPTLVNGKTIKEHELRDGDKIQIGPYECVYSMRMIGAAPKVETSAPMGTTLVDAGGDAMTGNLAEMSCFALLRNFEVRQSTGTLTIRQPTQEGRIVLDKGKIVAADAEGQQGKKALFVLLSWREGTFSFSLEKKQTGKIFRTFNYNAVGPADDFKRTTITDLLEEAQDAGVEEPLTPGQRKAAPPAGAPKPKAGAPKPGAPRPPTSGKSPIPGRPGLPPKR
jgi:hypothetical protein